MNEGEIDNTRNTFLRSVHRAQAAIATLDRPTIRPTSRMAFRRMETIVPRPIHWLWPGRFARGKVSMIAGHPGLGKSQVTASLAATTSKGGRWPADATSCEASNVVILSCEDDPEDTIRPRLEAAGADLSRIVLIDTVVEGVGTAGETQRTFTLKDDLARLADLLEQLGDVGLVVIDPITAYLGHTDSHKNAEIRALLAPLAALAATHQVAVIAVSHFNKDAHGEALMRVTGSLAFVAASRSAFVVARDPQNDDRRLFLPLKNNIGNDRTGLAFSISEAEVPSPAGPIATSHVRWEETAVTTTAEEAMRPLGTAEERSELAEAREFLVALLADGPVPSRQVQRDAEEAGHSWRTIQRAQKALGVIAVKDGKAWTWRLDRRPPPLGGLGDLGGLHSQQCNSSAKSVTCTEKEGRQEDRQHVGALPGTVEVRL